MDQEFLALEQILLGNNSIATFLQSNTQYTVDRLTLGSKSTLQLPAGTYWINQFAAQANAKIEVVGEGQVTLFVQGNFSLPLNFKIMKILKTPHAFLSIHLEALTTVLGIESGHLFAAKQAQH